MPCSPGPSTTATGYLPTIIIAKGTNLPHLVWLHRKPHPHRAGPSSCSETQYFLLKANVSHSSYSVISLPLGEQAILNAIQMLYVTILTGLFRADSGAGN